VSKDLKRGSSFLRATSSATVLWHCVQIVAATLVTLQPELVAAKQTNVLLIVSDDHHWADYGFMGHEHVRTPHLDRLARESRLFPRGYVTSSLCCPSLATIITGRYPHQHLITCNDPPEQRGVGRNTPDGRRLFINGRERMNVHLEQTPTLPAMLAQSGYESFQTGKWWQGHFRRGGFTQGMTRGDRHGDEGLSIGRTSMQPIYDFVSHCRNDAKPFLVWYAPMLPHDPHDPSPDIVEHYAQCTQSKHIARYWGNIERFDRTVGDLLDFLDRENLSKETLVVYVTDNGWIQSMDKPGFAPRSKLSPYDGGLRTPIMLRQPGTITAGRSEAHVSSIDLAPTILAACGISPPPSLMGVNLLDESKVTAREEIFGECFTHTAIDLEHPEENLMWRWMVRGQWKLIVPATADGNVHQSAAKRWEARLVDPSSLEKFENAVVELYNIAADPEEKENCAVSHPDLVSDLRKRLDAWWKP
ncbi:MAG: sulfatase-like hydrolase/transferase, partial [Planctomycetia bacterium]|nr:sulfatase-like hydrolase/transferase [Planctomycetia bacterium]